MEQIKIDYLSEHLFNRSIRENVRFSYEEAEQLCLPMIELLGITQEERNQITQYAVVVGDYAIDAKSMMVDLGIMADGQRMDKSKRTLERCGLIPKNLNLASRPLGRDANEEENLFTNRHCMVIRKTEIKNGKTYRPIKYMITRNACYKLLVRSPNADKYADYLLLLQQITAQYGKYISDYNSHTFEMKDGKNAK